MRTAREAAAEGLLIGIHHAEKTARAGLHKGIKSAPSSERSFSIRNDPRGFEGCLNMMQGLHAAANSQESCLDIDRVYAALVDLCCILIKSPYVDPR